MSYPSIEKIAEEVKAWNFIINLPQEIYGFVKQTNGNIDGQILHICQYVNKALKAKLEAANQAAVSPKQQLRNALFGEGKIGDDMSFSWVNKDNLLATFKTFTETVQNNKDAYTREDWDEIKLLYEALGTRKNTVEKEGLSSSDNNEIAGIKIKFAPMLKVNRMGAKAEENAAAKE